MTEIRNTYYERHPEALLPDVNDALTWLLDHAERYRDFFQCDCEPGYESDTGAWNHDERCASGWEDHLELLADRVAQLAGQMAREGQVKGWQ